jgi:hypothetical protein
MQVETERAVSTSKSVVQQSVDEMNGLISTARRKRYQPARRDASCLG